MCARNKLEAHTQALAPRQVSFVSCGGLGRPNWPVDKEASENGEAAALDEAPLVGRLVLEVSGRGWLR